MSGIGKRFGRLQANDNISLSLQAGEILALLGENGAGKTTLMNILFGYYVADRGSIEVNGRPLRPGSIRAALDAGIGMVQQHFALADNLSVLDNILVGTERLSSWRRRTARLRQKIHTLADQCGFELSLDTTVASLSVGERQKVEIIKVLFRGARVLVLDEPTAVLTPQETKRLFATLHKITARGMAVIFISHKIKDILAISNRVCVLRQGCLALSTATADCCASELAQAMIGRALTNPTKSMHAPGTALLELDEVQLKPQATPMSFVLREREILGITGIAGNGQAALSSILNGLTRPAGGQLRLGGCTAPRAAQMASLQVARIPEDRSNQGVIGDMSVAENLISTRRAEFSRLGILHTAKIRSYAERLLSDFDVRCATQTMPARLLSGGNMQKLILARELAIHPRLIIACQPSRGLDLGAIDNVHRKLLAAKADGAGILLITEDLDELLLLADRAAVMFRHQLSAFMPSAELGAETLGLMMSGAAAS